MPAVRRGLQREDRLKIRIRDRHHATFVELVIWDEGGDAEAEEIVRIGQVGSVRVGEHHAACAGGAIGSGW